MPSSATTVFLGVEFVMLLCGIWLLWTQGFSPTARARVPLLPTWDVSLSDFFLFLWLAFMGGTAGMYATGFYLKSHPHDTAHQLILGTGAMHIGMLLGMALYRIIFARKRPPLGCALPMALSSGAATFLVSLPVLFAVGFVWQLVLKLCHYDVKSQDSIELLRHVQSPWLKTILVLVAVLIAPISEELIFRVGIFRYLRTRTPRWIALLLPALLFALLHLDVGSFVPLVTLAVIFSLAYERTGNIGTTIVAHALFNLNSALLVLSGIDS